MKTYHYKGQTFTQNEVDTAKQLIDLELGIITQEQMKNTDLQSGIKAGALIVMIGRGTELALERIKDVMEKEIIAKRN